MKSLGLSCGGSGTGFVCQAGLPLPAMEFFKPKPAQFWEGVVVEVWTSRARGPTPPKEWGEAQVGMLEG